jgi:hypothetical protein
VEPDALSMDLDCVAVDYRGDAGDVSSNRCDSSDEKERYDYLLASEQTRASAPSRFEPFTHDEPEADGVGMLT